MAAGALLNIIKCPSVKYAFDSRPEYTHATHIRIHTHIWHGHGHWLGRGHVGVAGHGLVLQKMVARILTMYGPPYTGPRLWLGMGLCFKNWFNNVRAPVYGPPYIF